MSWKAGAGISPLARLALFPSTVAIRPFVEQPRDQADVARQVAETGHEHVAGLWQRRHRQRAATRHATLAELQRRQQDPVR